MASAASFLRSAASVPPTGAPLEARPRSTSAPAVLGAAWRDSSADAPSLVGRVVPPARVSPEAVAHICGEMKVFFPSSIARDYRLILEKSADLNETQGGFSIFHYAVHVMGGLARTPGGEKGGVRLLAFVEYLLDAGANPRMRDSAGREAICFASSLAFPELNRRFWDRLLEMGMELNPTLHPVSPLHVAASSPGSRIVEFLERGADVYKLDCHGRTALHCAMLRKNYVPESDLENIIYLLAYGPAAVEVLDRFENYPLYYALLFGSAEIIDWVLEASPFHVVAAVRRKIEREPFASEMIPWRLMYDVDCGFYMNPDELLLRPGGAPPKKGQKEEALEKLAAAQKAKKPTVTAKDGIKYDAYHDGHGDKHIACGKKAFSDFKADRRGFVQATTDGDAQFFPTFCGTLPDYSELIFHCVTNWVEKGADPDHLYVTFPKLIGADRGKETAIVEIYRTSSGGVHVRPKAKEYLFERAVT